jgi:arabinogalactan oligomer/maltooligosaccharide transport system permease protein
MWSLLLPIAAAAAPSRELTVWHTWRGEEQRAIEAAAAQWGAANDVAVLCVAYPFGGFDAKLETAIPRGNGPDVFVAGHSGLGRWVPMGLLVPVDREPHALPTAADAMELDGRSWGVPLAMKTLVLFYDPTRVTTPPTTTTELAEMAARLRPADGYGLLVQSAEPYFHAPIMTAFGGALFTDGRLTLDTPAQIRAMELHRELLLDSGLVPPQPTAELVAKLYSEGKAPFVLSGPWFTGETTRPIAAAPLPAIPGVGPMRPFLTVETAFVAADRPTPALALEFARWLGGEEGARIRSDLARQAVTDDRVLPTDPLAVAVSTQARDALPQPVDPRLGTAWESMARALRDVANGVPSDRALASAQAYGKAISKAPPPAADPRPYAAVAAVLALAGAGYALYRAGGPSSLVRRMSSHRWDYPWVTPAGLALSVLVAMPLVAGATTSLFEYVEGSFRFVGFANFLSLLLARDFPLTSPLSFFFKLAVTVLWTAVNVFLHVVLGVTLALALREPWIRLRGVWRALLVVPWAIPNYITALVWKGMFHAQYGAVNTILSAFSGQDVRFDWFSSFLSAFTANLVTNTWLGFPFMMVTTLGVLTSIPRDLEEAARIDGATWWQRLRFVIWPQLAPGLLPAVVLGSVWTFNLFNVVFLVSQGEPNSTTEILVSEAYRWAFTRGNRYGYAAAYAVLVFVVLVVFSRGADRLMARRTR